MKTCIDLKSRFGRQYKIEYEASYQADRGRWARCHEPWLLILPCRFGHIYPHGGELLAASTKCRGPIANELERLPCGRVLQDGDDGINVVFHIKDFAVVAQIMKPRMRRTLSPQKRAEQIERLREHRFKSACQAARGDHKSASTNGA